MKCVQMHACVCSVLPTLQIAAVQGPKTATSSSILPAVLRRSEQAGRIFIKKSIKHKVVIGGAMRSAYTGDTRPSSP